ncbi:histidine--tRNA ligase [Candidatus Woesebacteria bacterium RIFCSPHIGHO2_01_FULL_39_32]|uniref:Histidine--tRNA ligase n=2 Tax=Candidatus Woeseibacteriota TaxID=1752722 RepID=A0A0G0PRQ6_9BACT|nr:MAG: Histidyl-tRNA synthetase [Candidatus Woesebacteria bacterium GW2011_GWA1_39_8]OGM03863.1 MAG: histidine--tRNA ligase [Candidatus Woesebacteria bacterium GWB1_37_5]OGM23910.1 MAG: histidine--tRNA ligase [Candidatus Woesebacteria bacterium RIFCSPHIGHO2_01_FULL_39_32]OGM37417.1 MAG: histidine--tRNA ligase [Candidatus Woesebacteria bacterium RIFCSPHIGHO2_12_FULL_38_11]OGM64099.1 MAG: histidine--tRNA ligase [Candidatus Woesebacteria bacterium RIFCSPLOWO2_01_FULL_39_25]
MDKQMLQPVKGFRDFLPKEAKKRTFLKNKFREVFELYGFEPLETPALEYQEVLLNKYGEEADKLVFKFEDEGGRRVALRYDQTVPTARILAMYQQNLPMPWRRYQIQSAYRAEKPQKGRFREFTQCDADIFGTTSPLSDAEILAAGNTLLTSLGFKEFKILINDRDILFQIMESAEIPENMQLPVIQTIDKLDNKTRGEVEEELAQKGISIDSVHLLFDSLDKARPTDRLEKTMGFARKLGIPDFVFSFTPRLARGLDYYNSTIYEFVIEGYAAGSVCGGGRYDNLINQLSGVNIPSTGYSWGFDRVIEAMEQFKLFPQEDRRQGVLVTVFSPEQIESSTAVVKNLRENKIEAEIFPDENTKLEKQLRYADKKGIKWLIVIGPEEVEKNTVILKDLETGKQADVKLEELVRKFKDTNE